MIIWYCWIPPIILAVILARIWYLIHRCCEDRDVAPEPTHPSLWVEDDAVALWMHIDNSFTGAAPSGTARAYNTGFLMQLGEFQEYGDGPPAAEWSVAEVRLYHDGGSEPYLTLTKNDFVWINLGKSWSTAPEVADARPMDWSHALQLFPSKIPKDGDFSDVQVKDGTGTWVPSNDANVTATPPYSPSPKAARKVRGRRLHALFDAWGIITYWQADGAWTMTSNRISDIRHTEHLFEFKHDLWAEVWKWKMEGSMATDELELMESPTTGGPWLIDRIEIAAVRSPDADRSTRLDPPWP